MKKQAIALVVGLSCLFATGFAAAQTPPLSAAEQPKADWDAIERAVMKEYEVCVEHCGSDPSCADRCRKAYDSRLERERQQLLRQPEPSQPVQSTARPMKPAKTDKCPVCGMFVAKYPDWVGEIMFKDGSAAFFDGAKDLFKYYFNLKHYNPAKSATDIAVIYVTEYYNMEQIDAQSAFFVIGSDIYGPMGKELIPFARNEDAAQFMRDHKGVKILTFKEVTPAVIKTLD